MRRDASGARRVAYSHSYADPWDWDNLNKSKKATTEKTQMETKLKSVVNLTMTKKATPDGSGKSFVSLLGYGRLLLWEDGFVEK